MVTSILTVVPATTGADPRAHIKSARSARDKIEVLIATLEAQRDEGEATLLRTLAADLAALKDAPTRAFADAEFNKYTAWSTADKELETRIEAFRKIDPLLDDYVAQLAKKHPTEFIAVLTELRAELEAQRAKESSDTAAIEARLKEIDAELQKYSTSAPTSRAKAKKAAARKSATQKKAGKRRP